MVCSANVSCPRPAVAMRHRRVCQRSRRRRIFVVCTNTQPRLRRTRALQLKCRPDNGKVYTIINECNNVQCCHTATVFWVIFLKERAHPTCKLHRNLYVTSNAYLVRDKVCRKRIVHRVAALRCQNKRICPGQCWVVGCNRVHRQARRP